MKSPVLWITLHPVVRPCCERTINRYVIVDHKLPNEIWIQRTRT